MTKKPKTRKAKEIGPADITDALENLVKGLDKVADKIGNLVNELDRASSAEELDHDVGYTCDAEGCENEAKVHRCDEHSFMFVEQVWVICVVGLSCERPGAIAIRASEQSARETIKGRIAEDAHMLAVAKNSMAHRLEHWNGQDDVTIGPWTIRVETVEL